MNLENLLINFDNWDYIFNNELFETPIDRKNNIFYKNGKKSDGLNMIFNIEIQEKVFKSLNDEYILLQGGTGIGKTRYLPIFIYKYLKINNKIKNPKILITEPRRSTVINPFNTMIMDLGQNKFKYDKLIDEKKEKDLITEEELLNITKEKFEERFQEITSNYYEYEDDIVVDENKNLNELESKRFISYQIGGMVKKEKDNGKSWIRFQTDGYFWNLINDKELIESIDVIIFDEVHENSKATLFTLVMLSLYKKYPKKFNINIKDLKIILITASLQKEELESYQYLFDNKLKIVDLPNVPTKPIIEIKINENDIMKIIKDNKEKNGILFLPSTSEIRLYTKLIYNELKNNNKFFIIPYTKLYDEKFNKKTLNILQLLDKYKYNYIVLATNIGESSITYPNLDFVIDNGKRNDIVYNYKTKITNQIIENINLNSRIQRRGRVGRTKPGTYYYIIEEKDLIQSENKLLKENIYEDILLLIDKLNNSDIYSMFKDSILNMFKDKMDSYFFNVYEKDLYNLNLINLNKAKINITNTYKDIMLIKKLFLINEEREFPFNKVPFCFLSFIYYNPTETSILITLMSDSGYLEKIYNSNFFTMKYKINKNISNKSEIENLYKSIIYDEIKNIDRIDKNIYNKLRLKSNHIYSILKNNYPLNYIHNISTSIYNSFYYYRTIKNNNIFIYIPLVEMMYYHYIKE